MSTWSASSEGVDELEVVELVYCYARLRFFSSWLGEVCFCLRASFYMSFLILAWCLRIFFEIFFLDLFDLGLEGVEIGWVGSG